MTADAKKPTRRATAPDKTAGDAVRPRVASAAMAAAQQAVSEAVSNQARDSHAAHRQAAQAVIAAVKATAK